MSFEAISITAMLVLLLWACLNLGFGIWGYHHPNIVKRYFWRMNNYWGLMNFALALVTLTSLLTWGINVSQSTQLQVISINLGLEVGYLLIGLAMVSLQGSNLTPRRFGYGLAVMVQAIFLVVFDSILLLVLRGAAS